ncbi:MAG: iron ABC transporter permease [Dehalococcoidia bacterium]|nr:iron ABC transporter permease [Dehalococcoidia bacterium]
MASVNAAPGGLTGFIDRGRKIELQFILMTILFACVAFVVLTPMWQILTQSFQVSKPGEAARWGFEGWKAVFTETSLQKAAWNTVTLSVTRQLFALTGAIFIAWLLARTDVPGRKIFEFVFWLAFFLPALTITLSWILVLDPQFGLLNQLLRGFKDGNGPFNIYSFAGIVWVHVMGTSLAVQVMILTPAFRNMNSAFEEASRISGASTMGTMVRIFIPLMMPVIVAVLMLSFLRSLEAFEIEQILGTPIGLYVFSTWIYDTLYQHIPRYDAVSALAIVMILLCTGLIFLQRRVVGKRQYTTVTGQFVSNPIRLGKWRIPTAVFLGFMCIIIVGVPMVFSVMGTFMKLFGFFIQDPWTLKQWETALKDRLLARAVGNTIVLAVSTAIVAIAVHSLIAYVIVRTRYVARSALDFLTWMPFTIPGIILSLGLLTMFLQPQFRPLYGTMPTLVIALVISGMPFAVQIMKSNLMQISKDLEEASFVSGGNWFHTYRRVVLPLISPTLVVIGVISFISSARNISQVALLSNTSIRPMSIMQLDYIAEGKYEVAAVIATILLFMSVILALVARVFGFRGVGSNQ